jgi:hypothetical protein
MSDPEIDAMSAVATAISDLDIGAKARVLRWAAARYGVDDVSLRDGTASRDRDRVADSSGGKVSDESATARGNKTAAKKTGSTSKAKQIFSLSKDLDLDGAGSPKFREFSDEKVPGNDYIDHVYTCFKYMSWRVPADLVNTVQKAGSKGWLDTRNRDDLKVVVMGENYVEHEMPVRNNGKN